MRFDKSFANRQSEPHARSLRRGRVELVEYAWQVLRGNSVAMVGHCDTDAACFHPCDNVHPLPGARILERIVENIYQGLRDQGKIHGDSREVRWRIDADEARPAMVAQMGEGGFDHVPRLARLSPQMD